MKILFISPTFFPSTYYGGPIYSTYELAKALKKTGVDVKVITTNANGKEKLKLKTGVFHKLENNLPVKYYNSIDSRGTSLSMLLNLSKEIKNSDIVYLVSIFSPPTPFTIFLCKLYKKPLIISPRGQLGKWCLKQGNIFKKIWLKIFIEPIANKITWEATSLSEKEMIKIVYPEARVEVISPIVNVEEFQPEAEQPLADKVWKDYAIYEKLTGQSFEGKKIIVSMGRLQKVKGFNLLIEAIGMIGKIEKQNVVLLIAGEDFGERKNLVQLIDKLGLKEKVFLIGMIEGLKKIEFLRNADLFALASHHENFGIVYAEALASGIPVVASTILHGKMLRNITVENG